MPFARIISFSLLTLPLLLWPLPGLAQTAEWSGYGGPGGRQYTPLAQIGRDNLDRLEIAWQFRSGDLNEGFARKRHSFQANPVFWNDTLYLSTSANWVLAVDAASGTEKWRYDPGLPQEIGYSESASRGVSLWHGDSTVCPHRVFLGTLVGEIHALDAETGELCADFGEAGIVDLSVGVGEVSPGDYGVTSPPAIIGDQLIVGSAIGDNRAVELERGIVRALDVRTGTVSWFWDPVPRSAGQDNYASWENDSGQVTGAANAWPPLVVDAARNLVFVPTGSPSPDFYGGLRLGDNRHANSLVALDTDRGEVVWSQQLVHHDTWDYDLPAQPTLAEITRDGDLIPAVIQVTKTGMLYAFHRDTGEPVYEIEERAVPASDIPGERLSPTQPFSSFPALADQSPVTVEDAFGVLFFDRQSCRRSIRNARSEGIFTPVTLKGSILNPGYAGGVNWGGIAVDNDRQIAVVNVNQIPGLVRLIPRDEVEEVRAAGELEGDWELARQEGAPYYMARRILLSPLGLPCTRPPWGKLLALDLQRESILWEVPLGSIRDLAPGLVPNFNWGVPNMGGPLLTASGLIFIGAAAEKAVRIFDVQSGAELWQHDMPAAPLATPMSYSVAGEQYIAIAAGGHDNLGLERGDYLVAFKLID